MKICVTNINNNLTAFSPKRCSEPIFEEKNHRDVEIHPQLEAGGIIKGCNEGSRFYLRWKFVVCLAICHAIAHTTYIMFVAADQC